VSIIRVVVLGRSSGMIGSFHVCRGGCPVDCRLPLVLVLVTDTRGCGSFVPAGSTLVALGCLAGRAGASTRSPLRGSLRAGGVLLRRCKPLAGFGGGLAVVPFLQLVNPRVDFVKAPSDLIPAACPGRLVVIVAAHAVAGSAFAFPGRIFPRLSGLRAQPLSVGRRAMLGNLLQGVGDLLLGGRHQASHLGHPVAQPRLKMTSRSFLSGVGHHTSCGPALDHPVSPVHLSVTATQMLA